MIAETAKIFPNVMLGKNVIIEDFCIIGIPFKGYNNELTVIGDNSIIRSHTCIYAGNKIGSDFQTGNKANIRELNIIGDKVSIGTMSVIEHHVKIGSNVRIHSQVFIPEYSNIEESAWLGPNVVLTNAKFPKSPNVKDELIGPILKANCKIGANSTILPGVVVGSNVLIGAGSVVVASIPDNVVAFGAPARVHRRIHY